MAWPRQKARRDSHHLECERVPAGASVREAFRHSYRDGDQDAVENNGSRGRNRAEDVDKRGERVASRDKAGRTRGDAHRSRGTRLVDSVLLSVEEGAIRGGHHECTCTIRALLYPSASPYPAESGRTLLQRYRSRSDLQREIPDVARCAAAGDTSVSSGRARVYQNARA